MHLVFYTPDKSVLLSVLDVQSNGWQSISQTFATFCGSQKKCHKGHTKKKLEFSSHKLFVLWYFMHNRLNPISLLICLQQCVLVLVKEKLDRTVQTKL